MGPAPVMVMMMMMLMIRETRFKKTTKTIKKKKDDGDDDDYDDDDDDNAADDVADDNDDGRYGDGDRDRDHDEDNDDDDRDDRHDGDDDDDYDDYDDDYDDDDNHDYGFSQVTLIDSSVQRETPFIHPPLKNKMYPRKHVLVQVLEQVVEVWFVHPTHPSNQPPPTSTFEKPEPLQVLVQVFEAQVPPPHPENCEKKTLCFLGVPPGNVSKPALSRTLLPKTCAFSASPCKNFETCTSKIGPKTWIPP